MRSSLYVSFVAIENSGLLGEMMTASSVHSIVPVLLSAQASAVDCPSLTVTFEGICANVAPTPLSKSVHAHERSTNVFRSKEQ